MTDPSNEAEATVEATARLDDQLRTIAAGMTRNDRPIDPDGLVEVALLAVPHARHVGVTLLRANRAPASAAASDGVPDELDQLQFALRDGPCLDAATGPPVVIASDVGSDDRWPLYGPRCVEATGVRSMLCLRLPLGGDDHAGMNFYSEEVDVFSDEDVAAGSLLVPFAALVIEAQLRQDDVRNLTTALESSRVISSAVGILMATHRLSRDDAFAVLRRTSMDLNLKLRAVAEHVEFTGGLPEPPARGR